MNNRSGTVLNVFTIPAGVPFLTSLARAILDGNLPHQGGEKPDPVSLTSYTILLPTRRAARALAAAFYDLCDNRAQLLPRIQPLGDIDEDELALAGLGAVSGEFEIPPAVSTMERRFVLYHLIVDWQQSHKTTPLAQLLEHNPRHGLDLARTLAGLVDGFQLSNVDIALIPDLFEGEFAGHREQLLQFLSIVQIALPEKLAELGKIGPVERRNRLIASYQAFVEETPPVGPLIAAGSTGSIPATARLLTCIAGLEQGAVILPGLDGQMDEESWSCLPQHHPQFAMRELLAKMNLPRDEVRTVKNLKVPALTRARNWLASEVMRPAQTTDSWRSVVENNRQTIARATNGLTVLAADDTTHEARVIALVMRRALHDNKTVALVTPDRGLARSVKSELQRWQIDVDDSAGIALKQTSQAVFLRLLLEAAMAGFSPLALKSLLAHPLANFALKQQDLERCKRLLEMCVLRQRKPYRSLNELFRLAQGFATVLAEDKYLPAYLKALSDKDLAALTQFAHMLADVLGPLEQVFAAPGSESLETLVKIHLRVAEKVATGADGEPILWQGDEGGELSDFFSNLLAAEKLAPAMTPTAYGAFIDDHLGDVTVRARGQATGQLAILGLLEARLVSTDITILGGLNETIWPAVAETDPWLNRSQLEKAGLSLPEQRIGLSAHDFVQGFCNAEVFLTYAQKLENSPAVPSRWLLRFAVMESATGTKAQAGEDWLEWARHLDMPDRFSPVARPLPAPPVDLRPRRFSVTGIDTLRKDPYRFYADKILKLKQLEDLEQTIGPLERGQIIHHALYKFSSAFPQRLPEKAAAHLTAYFERAMNDFVADPALKVFWRPQLQRIADWFCQNEKSLRLALVDSKLEVNGSIDICIGDESYTLTARADRVDILDDNTCRIIDYKTGQPPTFNQTAGSYSSQLLLEAHIAREGGFEDVPALPAHALVYIHLSGGIPAGKTSRLDKNVRQSIDQALEGTCGMIACYSDPATGYRALEDGKDTNWDVDYRHLSRWREWSHLASRGDGDG